MNNADADHHLHQKNWEKRLNNYVYQHHDPITKEIVYVGIGTKNRAWIVDSKSRKKEHRNWMVEKFENGENIVAFVNTKMTKLEAHALERDLIEKHQPKFNRTGTKVYSHKKCGISKEQALKCQELRKEGLSYKAISAIVWPESKGYMQAWKSVNHFDAELLV